MRRPPVLIAAAGAIVIALGAVLVFVLSPAGTFDPVPSSGSGVSASPSPPPQDLLSGPRSTIPVLLVHGYAGAPSQMQPLADRLRQDGRRVLLVQLPARGTLDVHVSALSVVFAARALHAPVIDVVGYSLGGVAARQSLLFRQPEIRVRHLVMLATPNHGVRLPDDSGRPNQPHCTPENACGQLAPGSPFLTDLDKSPLARGRDGWLTVASTTDKLVRPPEVVALKGAKNLVLQDVCPTATEDHGQMDDSPTVLGLAVLFLDGRLPVNPTCNEALGAASA
ncbi:MAG TPA: hypothetical protein VLR26_03505 [Frankiaceae bacterium]|nr:hypothetical protein [Frankiaceae bacterium]